VSELAESLEQIVGAWRQHRHARLGDLADALDAALAPSIPPLAASKKKADLDAWRAREERRDLLDFGALMRAARGGKQEDVSAHVAALAGWKDPRLVRGLFALLEDPPYAGVKSRGLLAEILAALEATRDPRIPVLARELAGRYLEIVNSGTGGWMVGELEALARRVEALPQQALPADVDALCATVEACVGKGALSAVRGAEKRAQARASLADLEARVYADPGDDGARLVYADALVELGDARGELIIRQITGRGSPRELLADAARRAAWAQPMSQAGDCVFERGFPARVRLFSKPNRASFEHPGWATVKRIDGLGGQPKKLVLEVLSRPAFRHLEHPGSLSAAMVVALAELPRDWLFRGLAVRDAHELHARVFERMPRLAELTLSGRGHAADALVAPLGELASLRLELRWPTDAFIACMAGLPRLVELALMPSDEPPAAGAMLPERLERLTIGGRTLGAMPAGIVPPRLRAIDLRLSSGKGLDAAFAPLDALESATLHVDRDAPAELFEGKPRLRRLDLRLVNLSARMLAPLAGSLEELEATWDALEPGALLPLTRLTRLAKLRCALDELPTAPLRWLHASAPAEGAALEEALARWPALAELHLDLESASAPAAEIAPIMAASGVARLRLKRQSTEVTLERDEGGGFSRMHVSGHQYALAIEVGRALGGVTSLELAWENARTRQEIEAAVTMR
jgi:uncharacterized protein (TIGR02996 family)